jgi:hypothetical protein
MSTFNRTTLVKVLEILDSSNAGEALAAAKLASTMLREAGLTWDDVLAPEIHGRAAQAPTARAIGAGPFGYRRDRELSPHEQFFMVLLSPRTPMEIKRKLRSWEARVLDGEDLRFMYQSFVVG